SLWIGLHHQMLAIVVMEWKLGQADNEVPVSMTGLLLQPGNGGLDVLRAGGERLTHDGDVPRLGAVGRAQVRHTACNVGRRGWISHDSDTDRLHAGSVPARHT